MCLSTVYKNSMNDESIIMKNVASIALDGNNVILTDLMENGGVLVLIKMYM